MSTSNLIDGIRNIDTSTLVDKVEKNLIELFIEKNLKVGDTIPKELELTKAMGVSRTVVREALLRLRMSGLVDTKKHRGGIISSPDLSSVLQRSMNPQMLDDETLKEIFEMRLSLEIGMADFIIQRVTPQDIAELREIVANEPPSSKSHLFQIDHEIKFHGKLYDITQNQTLKNFQKMLLPVFDFVHHSGLLNKQVSDKKYVSHKQLVDLIEKGSAEHFRNGMRNHLENHFKRLFS